MKMSFRKSKIALSALTISLFLAGCSQNSTLDTGYDAVDLIHYEACIKFAIEAPTNQRYSFYAEVETDRAKEYCKKYLPVKK